MHSKPIAFAVVVVLLVAGGCGEDDVTTVLVPVEVPVTAADLSDLAISAGTLSPDFSPGTTFYTVGPGLLPSSVTVTPTGHDSGATIMVNGSVVATGTPSVPIGLGLGMNTITIMVTAADGVTRKGYTILVCRVGQEAYLKASNTADWDEFGSAVAISGDTIVVGTPYQGTDSGAAYVFNRAGGVWSQQAYLKASNAAAFDSFGNTVAVDGDTIVVGAWHEDSSATGVNGDQSDNSAGYGGAAYVFTRTGGVWTQQAYLKASNTQMGDRFGRSVAVSGDTVVVGAPYEESSATGVNGDQTNNSANYSGAAYVFTRTGGTWSQQAYLKASNTQADDRFGSAVAADGDTIVVGALYEDSGATDSGAAYVFMRTGGVWSQQAYLKASNAGWDDEFGGTVAVDGDTIVVGAWSEASAATGVNGDEANNSFSDSGAAYVFTRTGGVWSQQAYLKASNTVAGYCFGISVAIDADTIVVGSFGEASAATGVNGNEADNSAWYSGAAYVFTRTGGVWSQQAYLKAANTDADDWFGYAVAVDGDTIVVAAPGEESDATGVNGDQNNNALDAGAAYVFR